VLGDLEGCARFGHEKGGRGVSLNNLRGQLVRLKRSVPEPATAEQERDHEFGDLCRWMFDQQCSSASELIAKGITTAPERFTRVGMVDLLTAERAYHALLLGTRLFDNEDERYVQQELAELARFGVDEQSARAWASTFEFKELGDNV
jgi:hypothetical protein